MLKRYRYYAADYATGNVLEIFRSDSAEFAGFNAGDLWRAKMNGDWSNEDSEIKPLLNLWLKGDFDPGTDEISEEEATNYLNMWRTSGCWPGRA